MRMLQNNLDPDVAERPEDLVVYGGTGKAARDWPSYHALIRTLTTLKDDETMLVQSGRPVGVFRTHEWAPAGAARQLEPGRRLGHLAGVPPAGEARPDHVRADDRRLLDLHRHAGHPAGHVRDVRRGGREALRRHPGRHADADRRLRRHGRRAAARGHHERRRLPGHRRRRAPAARAGSRPATSTSSPTRSTRASRWRCAAKADRKALSIGVVGNAATLVPEILRRGVPVDIVTDQTSRARPALLHPGGHRAGRRARLRGEEAGGVHRPGPRLDGQARRGDGRLHGRRRRGVRLRQLDPRRGGGRRLRAGVRLPRLRAGLHPAAVLRGQGPVPVGRAVRRPGRHRQDRQGDPRPVPGERVAAPAGSRWPASGSRSRACRPGSAGSATASGTRPASASTTWSRAASSPPRS